MGEQMGIFLASLWLCATIVSCDLATYLGALSVISRLLFPILWSRGDEGRWTCLVELSTQPYYLGVLGMLGAVGVWAFTGVNIVDSYPAWGVALIVLGLY